MTAALSYGPAWTLATLIVLLAICRGGAKREKAQERASAHERIAKGEA